MNNSDEYKFRFANANWTAFVVLIIVTSGYYGLASR